MSETLALVFSCEFGEISKNTVFYRTPPVAASETTGQTCFKPIIKRPEQQVDIALIFLLLTQARYFGIVAKFCFYVKGN